MWGESQEKFILLLESQRPEGLSEDSEVERGFWGIVVGLCRALGHDAVYTCVAHWQILPLTEFIYGGMIVTIGKYIPQLPWRVITLGLLGLGVFGNIPPGFLWPRVICKMHDALN